MKFKKIDHIGIAVPSLEEAVKNYKALLGKDPSHTEEIEEQKVKIASFTVGETDLELLESTSPEGPISKFIKRRGQGGIHHICIEVEGIEAIIEEYKKQGILLVSEKPQIGAGGKRVVFINPSAAGGVLIELSEGRG